MNWLRNAAAWSEFEAPVAVPSLDELFRGFRIPHEQRWNHGRLEQVYRDCIPLYSSAVRPRGGWVQVEPQEAAIELFVSCPDSPLKDRLSKAGRAALFVVTLGEGPEELVEEYARKGKYVMSSVLDCLASRGVEHVVERLQKIVAASLQIAKPVRFSPGYGKWSLDIQPRLLDALKARDDHGITLTDGFMMIPKKSTSGVIVPWVLPSDDL